MYLIVILIKKLMFEDAATLSYTVKLGYNELGHNEHSVITNKIFRPNWSFYYIYQPGYNEPLM